MANVPETATWETGIYQFEITDPVLGGPDGIDNVPSKQLANRTLYLKQQQETTATTVGSLNTRVTNVESTNASQNTRLSNLESDNAGIKGGTVDFATQPIGSNNKRPATTEFVTKNRGGFSGRVSLTANAAILPIMAGNAVTNDANGNFTFTVGNIDTFKEADVLTFVKTGTGVLQINFANTIVSIDEPKSQVFLYPGEVLRVTRVFENWVLMSDASLFLGVGEVNFAHVLRRGCLELNGALLNRADYPRLWAYAQTTNIVTDAAWASTTNKGKFSSGNGSTTFRLPDFRDVFTRSKSAGREVGNYQPDELKSHQHLGVPGGYGTGTYNQIGSGSGSQFKLDGNGYTVLEGGEETRPKNIALIQMIKY